MQLDKYVMTLSGYYGEVSVNSEIFKKLNRNFFISHCTDGTKYMCANQKQEEHLKNLGITIGDEIICDWFEINLIK